MGLLNPETSWLDRKFFPQRWETAVVRVQPLGLPGQFLRLGGLPELEQQIRQEDVRVHPLRVVPDGFTERPNRLPLFSRPRKGHSQMKEAGAKVGFQLGGPAECLDRTVESFLRQQRHAELEMPVDGLRVQLKMSPE